MWNEARVLLEEAHKFCDIPNNSGGGPMLEELMLRLSGAIAVGADIDTNKFKTLWEEFRFLEAQQEALGLGDA